MVHNSEFFRKPNQELFYQNAFWCGLVLDGLIREQVALCSSVFLTLVLWDAVPAALEFREMTKVKLFYLETDVYIKANV